MALPSQPPDWSSPRAGEVQTRAKIKIDRAQRFMSN